MNKKNIGAGVIAVLLAGYIFAAPYITVNRMKNAAENHDGETLSEYVDFPTLRQSLKDQMNAKLAKEMAQEVDDNPFAALGAVFGGMMVDKMVDAYVTSAGITELMKGVTPDSEPVGSRSESDSTEEAFANASMSYESFSKFAVTISDDESNDDVRFILRRQGIGWKLTEIMLPL